MYKVRPHVDDAWGSHTYLFRKYTFCAFPSESQVVVTITEGTNSGPVLGVRIVKLLMNMAWKLRFLQL